MGNTLELNKKTMQRIMLLITFAVLLFWGLYNISTIGGLFSNLCPCWRRCSSARASPLC